MKKIEIILATFAVALSAVSCQKESCPETKQFTPMTICAESEGINAGGVPTKTEMAYKYDVLWSGNDRIFVTDGKNGDTFTLSDGAGTTKGTFKQDGTTAFGDEVEAYYPESLVQDGDLVWPATMENNQTVPMYSRKSLSDTETEYFPFASLGSVFQLTFSTVSKNIVLESVEVRASEALSGKFTVNEDGQAVISQPEEGGKPGITLDLGEEGVKLGVTAKKFNVAVPAGTYNDLTIIFSAKDGRKCTIKAKTAQTIEYNTVTTLALSGEFKYPGSLNGMFSVGAGKKVCFSQGDLYFDGSAFKFETNQYDIASSWNTGHISHFYWSRSAEEAVKEVYNEDQECSGDDVLFTNDPADPEKPNGTFVVNGVTGGYRTLSAAEWQYLFAYRTYVNDIRRGKYKTGVTVCGQVNCAVIAPDDWDLAANPLQSSYGTTASEGNPMTWAQAEAAGLVCLPSGGLRDGSTVYKVDEYANHWSSSASSTDSAYYAYITDFFVSPDDTGYRFRGFCIRLVADVRN